MVAQFPRLSSVSRRRFLYAAAVWPLLRTAHAVPKSGRVVIAGAGWGGLRAAAALRQYAPGLEVTLVDRSAYFTSFSGSNRWLLALGVAGFLGAGLCGVWILFSIWRSGRRS